MKSILITGAAGNLGGKLRRHLEGRYALRLLDLDPRGDEAIARGDLSQVTELSPPGGPIADLFRGVDTVVHLAANAVAQQTWPDVIRSNIDGVVNMFQAAIAAGVRRVVYASSNHVMGGYKDDPLPTLLTPETPPRPGTRYQVGDEHRDSTPYAAAKLFGERLGSCYSQIHGLSVIAVRIGWVRPGDNLAADIPPERGDWFRLMWLSNRDYCQLMERAIVADPSLRFAVINGMSANTGMRWDLEDTRRLLGYEPQDDVAAG